MVTQTIALRWDDLSPTAQAWAVATDRRPNKGDVRNWHRVAGYVATFCDDGDEGAADVAVEVGRDRGVWFLRTTDDAGGSDDADDTAYATRDEAASAADDLADDMGQGQPGEDSWEYLARIRHEALVASRDASGRFYLVSSETTGKRWDAHRYGSLDDAEKAKAAWYDAVSAANPGTTILFHLMETPVVHEEADEA